MFWQSLRGHVITDARWDGDALTHVEISRHTLLELPPRPELALEDIQGIVWAATMADPEIALRINKWAKGFQGQFFGG